MAQADLHKGRWYIKKDDKVQGPFPNQLISSYLVLGRITLQTTVSQDQVHWIPLKQFPALVPEVVLNAGTAAGNKALMLARVREDERSAKQEDEENERRADEDQIIKLHRQLRDDVLKSYRHKPLASAKWIVAVLLLIVGLLLLVLWLNPSDKKVSADCNQLPKAGVNWSFCRKQGQSLAAMDLSGANFNSTLLQAADFSRSNLQRADLSYADLSQTMLTQANLQGAKLLGANLQQAKLQGANLASADLSYAELMGAQLEGANLKGANLSNAIWINGQTCLNGSVGACLLSSQ